MTWVSKDHIEPPSVGWIRGRKARRGHELPSRGPSPLPLPDLLYPDERLSMDPDRVERLLELSFLGKEGAGDLDRVMVEGADSNGFDSELFAEDLFLETLIRSSFRVEIDGLRFPVNQAFLRRILASPPVDLEGVVFRQEILRELEPGGDLLAEVRLLYRRVSVLLDMFKAPDHAAQLDINTYRLDILRQAKTVIDQMADGFGDARSGLRRLHERGTEMRESTYYKRLRDLLEFEAHASTLTVSLNIGADGEIKNLHLLDLEENVENPFHRPLFQRWWLQVKSFLLGHRLSRKGMVQGILHRVFEEISPALVPLVQIAAHLEVYLASLGFRDRLRAAGLGVSLAEVGASRPIRLDGLSNPLLLDEDRPTVPCDVGLDSARALTLVTGPNSGGKTRLLQSLGLAQLLGQSGLYVAASRAELPLVRGMFVSLVETETADQAEGRLGRELLRIRGLFARVGSPSLVILDELCSGTNPAEGVEIFSLVLRLLDRMGTDAFISTHFLDYVRELSREPTVDGLRFLQVEPAGEGRSTYQFVDGVADSSLAQETARRLGVTFEELSRLIDRRLGSDETGERPTSEPAPALVTDTVSR